MVHGFQHHTSRTVFHPDSLQDAAYQCLGVKNSFFMWQSVVFKERNERNDSDNYLWRKLDDDVAPFGHRQFTTNPLPKSRHAEVYIDRHLIKGMFDTVLNNCRMGQKTRISATQHISSHSQAFFASNLTNDESLGDEPAIEEKK
jgi:hypothetical protein